MDDAADPITVMADITGGITHWTPGAERVFGWTAAQAVGASLDLIVPPEHRERHWAAFRQVVETGEGHLDRTTNNLPVVCADGEVRAVPGRVVLLHDPHGRFVGALGVYAEPRGDEQPFTPGRRELIHERDPHGVASLCAHAEATCP